MVEMIYFFPLDGTFDHEKIDAYLLSQPFTFRDPAGPYLMCGNEAFALYARQKRAEGGEFPSVCLVSVDPKEVVVRQLCEEDELAQSRQFVEWLLNTYECQILDDNGNDWTEECKESVSILYDD